jgi:hypothetical protein
VPRQTSLSSFGNWLLQPSLRPPQVAPPSAPTRMAAEGKSVLGPTSAPDTTTLLPRLLRLCLMHGRAAGPLRLPPGQRTLLPGALAS